MIRIRAPGINNTYADEGIDIFPSVPFKKNKNAMLMLLALTASFFVLTYTIVQPSFENAVHTSNVIIKKTTYNDPCLDEPMRHQGVPTFKNRIDLGLILERENMTVGAELGVQRGLFAQTILKSWPSCREFILVDVWAHQENYIDGANVDQAAQNMIYQLALENTKEWKEKIRVCRNFTSVCVETIPDGSLDFVYVDARHDFKGVYSDVSSWWPKLRPGGIMVGHDYVTQDDGPEQNGEDWATNYDGTKDETRTVVKGAVDKFSTEVCRQLTVSYREGTWNTWAMRK